MMAGNDLLELKNLEVKFPVKGRGADGKRRYVKAVSDVTLTVKHGETLGLVGESGCGKSTLARAVVRLADPTSGQVIVNGDDITKLGRRAMIKHRQSVQMVFQDPYSSLTPSIKVGDLIEESLVNFFGKSDSATQRESVVALFKKVGLKPEHIDCYPHEFSGGQRQRIGIARALALNPALIVADEPVSALDASVQAQVINLMMDLQAERNLAYLFISHDLAVVQHISHRIAVMYLGRIVETAKTSDLYRKPLHPYTEMLMDSVPDPRPGIPGSRKIISGDVPSPIDPPSGCAFHTRCPLAEPICREKMPTLVNAGEDHSVACHVRARQLPVEEVEARA